MKQLVCEKSKKFDQEKNFEKFLNNLIKQIINGPIPN